MRIMDPVNVQVKLTAAHLGRDVGPADFLSPLPPAQSLYDIMTNIVDIRISDLRVQLDRDRLFCILLVAKAAANLP